MIVATRTISINAAFLREIKDDNRELRSLLARGDAVVKQLRQKPGQPRAHVEFLQRLRDQLAVHFSLEEAYGYFENALEASPRLSYRATALRSEHERLFKQLSRVVEMAERWLYATTEHSYAANLATHFECFLRRLHQHEEAEIDLIFEAFETDIGNGD